MTEISEERQNIEVLATYIKEMGVGGWMLVRMLYLKE